MTTKTIAAMTSRSRFAPVSAQMRAYGGAFHRKVRPKAELVKVWVSPSRSTCCGCAEFREPGDPPCGCQDVDTQLTFRVGPLVKGRPTWKRVIRGEVTLIGGEFQGAEWSWCPAFLREVEALVGESYRAQCGIEADIEADIKAAVARKAAAA